VTDAVLAAQLLAIDPVGLGGVWVKGRVGPTLDRWLETLRAGLPPAAPARRLPAGIADDRLIGGIDLAATLQSGKPAIQRGLLAETDGGVLVVPMAERLMPDKAARLARALDTGEVAAERDGFSGRWPARLAVVAIDENDGEESEDGVAPVLLDRLALTVDLRHTRWRDSDRGLADTASPGRLADARRRLAGVALEDAAIEALCGLAMALGVDSPRTSVLAVRCARAHAVLRGRDGVEAEDLEAAVRLVLAPRATQLPAEAAEPEAPESEENGQDPGPGPNQDPGQDPSHPDDETGQPSSGEAAGDRLADAARAAIPPDLLARLAAGNAPRGPTASAGRRGEDARARRRGRPMGSVPGDPRRGDRLNLADTLRAAAPWQRLRGRQGRAVQVRAEDFRVTRFRQRNERVTVFVVDASGSAALHRLSEAKGAVELLLAECYVRRDQVALVAFRGDAAELLLPPTRSLVRAQRGLVGLPGGGATPLASGLDMAGRLGLSVERGGRTPALVVLTDGRGNVGRDGERGRVSGQADALDAARRIALAGLPALVVDTGPRPRPEAAELAAAMRTVYLPLPQADAAAVTRAVLATAPATRGRA